MTELLEIENFILEKHISDFIPEMENQLDKCIGYSQRIGELENLAEYNYSMNKEKALERLSTDDSETETTRRAKLEAWVADDKKTWRDLKLMNSSLKAIKMSLMQAIKTRREEVRLG